MIDNGFDKLGYRAPEQGVSQVPNVFMTESAYFDFFVRGFISNGFNAVLFIVLGVRSGIIVHIP